VLRPYRLEIIENCQTCKSRAEQLFCNLSTDALRAFDAIKCATAYPSGAVLFSEGQMPCGVFVLCQGRVKMSTCDKHGKKLIVKINKPGEVLGLSATVLGKPYDLTAETAEPCQVTFVKRHQFLRFLNEHADVCFKVAEQLSEKYGAACAEIRSLGVVRTADQKLAKLLVQWSENYPTGGEAPACLELSLTQEELGQLIGTTRETVIRTLSGFKKEQILEGNRSVLIIRDLGRLRRIAGYGGLN
jgi:CRP/FNR family transcriptional regulator, cyclic AMP receptor protein